MHVIKTTAVRRLRVLWRHAEWRCECLPAAVPSARETLALFMGETLVAQHQPRNLHDALRVSSAWREIIVAPVHSRREMPALSRPA